MRKIRQLHFIALLFSVILVFIFYWFGFRPQQIKKYCIQQAKIGAENKFKEMAKEYPSNSIYQKQAREDFFYQSDYDYCYKLCLKTYGLSK